MGHADRRGDVAPATRQLPGLPRGPEQVVEQGSFRSQAMLQAKAIQQPPKDAAREGSSAQEEGYLVGFVWDGDEQKSKVVVMDAAHISAGPVCRLSLPVRVHPGFHATWVTCARLKRGH